jgi:hypothetical protein
MARSSDKTATSAPEDLTDLNARIAAEAAAATTAEGRGLDRSAGLGSVTTRDVPTS